MQNKRLKNYRRDPQQNLVYGIEDRYWDPLGKEEKMKMADIRKVCYKILKSEKLKNYLKFKTTCTNISKVKISVLYRTGKEHDSSLCTWTWNPNTREIENIIIQLLPCHRTMSVVLHELAHAVAAMKYEKAGHHDKYFCSCYLWLVKHFYGKEEEQGLRKEFNKHGVKHRV